MQFSRLRCLRVEGRKWMVTSLMKRPLFERFNDLRLGNMHSGGIPSDSLEIQATRKCRWETSNDSNVEEQCGNIFSVVEGGRREEHRDRSKCFIFFAFCRIRIASSYLMIFETELKSTVCK